MKSYKAITARRIAHSRAQLLLLYVLPAVLVYIKPFTILHNPRQTLGERLGIEIFARNQLVASIVDEATLTINV